MTNQSHKKKINITQANHLKKIKHQSLEKDFKKSICFNQKVCFGVRHFFRKFHFGGHLITHGLGLSKLFPFFSAT